jgi:hypothetical protein
MIATIREKALIRRKMAIRIRMALHSWRPTLVDPPIGRVNTMHRASPAHEMPITADNLQVVKTRLDKIYPFRLCTAPEGDGPGQAELEEAWALLHSDEPLPEPTRSTRPRPIGRTGTWDTDNQIASHAEAFFLIGHHDDDDVDDDDDDGDDAGDQE